MHELDLIDKIFNVVVDQAKKQNFTHVDKVTLKVGRMNGLEKHHFTTALSAREEEMLRNTDLTIEEIPVKLACSNCDHRFVDHRFDDPHFAHATSHAPHMYLPPPCPSCSNEGAKALSGQEMTLTSIEGK